MTFWRAGAVPSSQAQVPVGFRAASGDMVVPPVTPPGTFPASHFQTRDLTFSPLSAGGTWRGRDSPLPVPCRGPRLTLGIAVDGAWAQEGSFLAASDPGLEESVTALWGHALSSGPGSRASHFEKTYKRLNLEGKL